MFRMIATGWSEASSIERDGENDHQLRSRSFVPLNVSSTYASGFKLPAVLLDDRFDHPLAPGNDRADHDLSCSIGSVAEIEAA